MPLKVTIERPVGSTTCPECHSTVLLLHSGCHCTYCCGSPVIATHNNPEGTECFGSGHFIKRSTLK